jgi:hypothetical protein
MANLVGCCLLLFPSVGAFLEHQREIHLPPTKPGPPAEWLVRIAEQQQTKAPRRAVYECLRRHRVPHAVAGQKANAFHAGLRVEIPLPERERAQTIVDQVKSLGLIAEVIEPVIAKQEEPSASAESL